MKRSFLPFLIVCGFLVFISSVKANNIRISNTKLTGQNKTGDYAFVQFDLSWENSWRSSSAPGNWDAAWVFVKYRVGSGAWQHAWLNDAGHSAGSGTAAAIDVGPLTPDEVFNATTNPALGVFIYRSADGTGTFSATGMKLRWNYGANSVADDAIVDIRVFAIEMVYVPQGAFTVGTGGTESGSFTNGSWTSGATIPLSISSENALTIGQSAGNLWGTSSSGNNTIGGAGTLEASFPKGYSGFYCQKYEISQQQYVDFLNTLTQTQADNRKYTGSGYRFAISGSAPGSYTTTNPYVACNRLSWMDGCAYSDWAGLRPMTELEFEKACRGTATPVAGEYAWGNTTATASDNITNASAINESTTTPNANMVYGNQTNVQGPMRVGVFASAGTTRVQSGAGYYGMMELSGNLWERAVTVGNATGRAFTGVHGNGSLSTNGNANETAWPGLSSGEVTGADGSGFRGGDWADLLTDTRVSDRTHAANPTSTRDNNLGFRAVRRVAVPNTPTEGTHVPSVTQLEWNWNSVAGAAGYKWNTTNDYATATDMATATTKTESGLTCGNAYSRYVWAYNSWGNSTPLTMTMSTSKCPLNCGTTVLTINHVTTGGVAPVNKSTTYGTVTNIPGETSKCWITKNLGATQQATAVDDATEESAGWYWQFNRKKGYKHDGTTLTPAWTLAGISENSNWITVNDPCSIELGTGWRLPTNTEWTNVDGSSGGNWSNWNGPWNSVLNLHASGYLNNTAGGLNNRGTIGYYWSSTSNSSTNGNHLYFSSTQSLVTNSNKAYGLSARCLRDYLPVVTTTTVTGITETTASSGGNVTAAGMSDVTARGVCYGTSTAPTVAGTKTSDGSGTGTFTSSLTDLLPGTLYYVRAYATNTQGTAYGNEVSFTTVAPFTCGTSTLSINHVTTGGVAPVNKNTTYGTVTNIPGETSKCWITKNLGADIQADSVNAKMETKAGWYWQFNRKQGYKHDGIIRTPNTTWISSINENSDWLTANDPCSLELGNGWRLPTGTEWTNLDGSSGGNWTNWNGPWGSGLKLHAAGYLQSSNGSLSSRGIGGVYWSSTQYSAGYGLNLTISIGVSAMYYTDSKAFGFSVRCLRD